METNYRKIEFMENSIKHNVSDSKLSECEHPKMQIWQYREHWLCCKCWHQEQGKYVNTAYAGR